MKGKIFLPILSAVLFSGCSIQTIALRSAGALVDYGFDAINEESDLQLAEQSIAANLKLLEGLLKGDPENEELLLLASRGYSSFALGFAEDDSPDRARLFYLRARDFGLRILRQNQQFDKAWNGDFESFQKALSEFHRDDVPAIFWTANSWGNYIKLSLTEPAAIADLPRVEALLKFALEKNETYFYGSAHLALGALLAGRPKLLSGDPEKARQHFERCLEISKGKFLLTYVYYAMTYAVQTQDRELYLSPLHKIEEASIDVLPEQRLANAIAKEKGRRLMEKISEFFE